MDSSGNPRIGYQDLSNMKLKYAERNSGLFWTNETVDSGNVGAYASLALDGPENPRISYYDAGHGFLKYASKNAGLWSTVAVDTTGNAGITPLSHWTTLETPVFTTMTGLAGI